MNEPDLDSPLGQPSAIAATTSLVAVVLFQLVLVALIFLRPDLDPSWHTISEWVIGPWGWLMRVAFLLNALSYGALFFLLRDQLEGTSGRVGLWILFVCFAGAFGVSIFTTDPLDGSVHSTHGAFHTVFGSAQLILLPAAALLINLNLSLRRRPSWNSARRVLLATAPLPLFGFLAFAIYTACFVAPLGPNAYGPGVHIGWPPRFAFLTYAIWIVTLTSRARRIGSQSAVRESNERT